VPVLIGQVAALKIDASIPLVSDASMAEAFVRGSCCSQSMNKGVTIMMVRRYLLAAALSALLAAPVFAQTTSPSTTTSRPGATTPNATQTQKQELVDINSASAQQLDKLPGIGPARAQAIIANRPYKGKDELAQRKIVPPNVYDQIKDKIVARQGTAKESTGSSSSTTKKQ
jgi:competence protein ComEA